MDIGILGLGLLGNATKKYFYSQGVKVYKYDKYKNIGSVEEVNRAGIVFICVPTPFHPKKGFDLSFVESAISLLSSAKIVIIKSSVVPGTTEALQTKFSQHKLLFNPEFLREATAYYDFTHPDRQILGYTDKSRKVARKILAILPKAPFRKIMPSREAEMVKYMANAFLSLKVVFANEFFELCKTLNLNFDQVRLAVGADPRITQSHLDVAHGGYRGFGGSCFPKDVNAILEFAHKRNKKMLLTQTMRDINRRLLKSSGLSEDYFLCDKHKIIIK